MVTDAGQRWDLCRTFTRHQNAVTAHGWPANCESYPKFKTLRPIRRIQKQAQDGPYLPKRANLVSMPFCTKYAKSPAGNRNQSIVYL